MRETDLPSPKTGANGYHLRRCAVKAISQIQTTAPLYTDGYNPAAADLKAFFVACADAVDTVSPEPV